MKSRNTDKTNPKKILIVDDDPLIRLGLEKLAQAQGFVSSTASTGEKALKKIEVENPDIIILDIKLPDSIDGLALLEIIKKTRPEITVIMISGQSEIRGAVDAMKSGARDYLEKPIDFDRLKTLLNNLKNEVAGKKLSILDDCIFAGDKMKKVVDILQRLALKSDITVLVLGESGTGKNFLCRKLHELSPRKDFPYVQIGCSNIPDHLIESELFGYEKGAFTDAKSSKQGLVEMAQGGTLLLDEIGEMPYQFQSKMLNLLEEKRFRRVGSLRDSTADVRILAATNRDLQKQVQSKRFRLDLYYRLNVATIELPPLRERPEDIPPLVENFLRDFAKKYSCPVKTIAEADVQLLQQYFWPGNVRQLKNLIERLVVLTEGDHLDSQDIASSLLLQQQKEEVIVEHKAEMPDVSGLSLKAMEEKYIRTALKLAAGNQRKAAQFLGISRDTLRYRLKKLGIG